MSATNTAVKVMTVTPATATPLHWTSASELLDGVTPDTLPAQLRKAHEQLTGQLTAHAREAGGNALIGLTFEHVQRRPGRWLIVATATIAHLGSTT